MLIAYIDPWAKDLLNDNLFDLTKEEETRTDYLAPWKYLREFCKKNGIILKTADKIPGEISNFRKHLYYSFGQLKRYRTIQTRKDIIWGSFYLFEPPIKLLPKKLDIYYHLADLNSVFNRIYTTSPIEAVNKCYGLNYKFTTKIFCYPQSHNSVIENYWGNSDRHLLVMVNSYRYSRLPSNEYYSERINALKYFFIKNSIDLYGSQWNRISGNFIADELLSVLWAIKWRSVARMRDVHNALSIRQYLRKAQLSINKYATLSKYKFAICYESMGIEGFISEKIFDCFFAGTIPVYLGAPDISQWIPLNTFIDKRSFKNYDDLWQYLKGMNNDQYEYFRENILGFLSSQAYTPFTKENFAERFIKDIIEDAKLIQ